MCHLQDRDGAISCSDMHELIEAILPPLTHHSVHDSLLLTFSVSLHHWLPCFYLSAVCTDLALLFDVDGQRHVLFLFIHFSHCPDQSVTCVTVLIGVP